MAGRVPARLTPAEGRRFGLQVGGAFLLLAGLAGWRGHPVAAAVLLAPGVGLLAAGLAAPGRLGPVHSGWMRVAVAISKVTTPLILGLVYLLVITPMGALLRLTGHQPLRRPGNSAGYWVARAADVRARRDMERQF